MADIISNRAFMRALLVSTAALASLPARAQTIAPVPPPQRAANDRVDDIIVTAQRREERLQDVPIAASAFNDQALARLNVTSTLDVAKFVPNLFAQHNTGLGTANGYYLRGLGNVESIATFDTPVGAYVDDIYIARQNSNNFFFFDVDRIEVLRGPQGTLFGRNTTGGSVNLYIRKPAAKFAGEVEAGVGSYGYYEVRGNVDVPVADGIRTKLSGYRVYSHGYVRNVVTGERLNGDNSWEVRGAASVDLGSAIQWNVAVAYIHDKALNILNTPCNRLVPTECNGRYAATGLASPLRTPTGRFATTNAPVSGDKGGFGLGNVVDNLLITSDVKIDLGGPQLDLITGYVDTRQHYAIDFFDGRSNAPGYTFVGSPPVPTFSAAQVNPPISNNPNGNFSLTNVGRFKQFTQEVKLSGKLADGAIDYVAGLFYFQERNVTDFADIFGNTLLADRVLRNTVESYAAYAQVDYRPIDWLTLTGGLRYTHETKGIDFFANRPACAASQIAAGCLSSANLLAATFPAGGRIPLSQSVDKATPRIAITAKPREGLLFFASATKGFRSGGWNARSSSVATVLPFGPESTWSYEGGVKSEWLDGRLRANATVFHTEIKGVQVLSSFVNPASGALTFISGNYADETNTGLELEFQLVPTRGLNLFANFGLQDPKYRIDRNAPTYTPFNVLSVNAQQRECQAALAGSASPFIADVRAAATRAQQYCGSGIVTPTGNIARVVRAPRFTLSAGASYDLALGSIGTLTPSVALSYYGVSETGSSNVNIFQDSSGNYNLNSGALAFGSRSDPTGLINASLTYNDPGNRVRVSVACDNCFDVAYVQSALSNFTYINPPRSWNAKVRVKF